MTRSVTTALANSLDDDVVYPFFAVDLEFDSGDVYMWTGLGEITISSKDYIGTGNLLGISSIEESSDLSVKGATLTLSGVPSTLITLALTEAYQGRLCRIYFGTMGDKTTYTEVFTGYMDQMNMEEGADSATITLAVESRLIDLERPRSRKYNNSDQKSRYSTDKGFEFVDDIQDKQPYWGR